MLDPIDPWLMREDLPLDDASDPLLAFPELRQLLDPDRPDEQLGLRSILDRPEALSRAWWHGAHGGRHDGARRITERRAGELRAG